MITVNGIMKTFNASESPNSNINHLATTLTWIVRMIYSNGKQTELISEILLPTNDPFVEWVFTKS
jgi:hypothetical protein